MGLTGSSEEDEEGPKVGFHILRVKQGSPADNAGFEAYFDYIVAIDGNRIVEENATLVNSLRENVNKKCSVVLYSAKYQGYREVFVIPSNNWGGDGILGCSIRFCSYENSAENVWHVLDVYSDSPASKAGFRPYMDFIIGTPVTVIRDKNDLFGLVEYHLNKELIFYVYNWETDKVREVSIVPDDNWGGEGALGCDIGFGYLHRIPNRVNRPTGASSLNIINLNSNSDKANGKADVNYGDLKFESIQKAQPHTAEGKKPAVGYLNSTIMEASSSVSSLQEMKNNNNNRKTPVELEHSEFKPVELLSAPK